VLVNRDWVDATVFAALRLVDVPPEEPLGANVLRLTNATLVSAAYPRTADRLHQFGHEIVELDVSELYKAEGA
jgi:dimethylargininase